MWKALASEPVMVWMGLATALTLCVTAFGPRLGLNPPEQDAIQAVILALAGLLTRSQTTSTNGSAP